MPPDQTDADRAPEAEVERDEAKAAGIIQRAMLRLADLRSWVHRRPGGARAWRIAVALIGLIVILAGVVLLPLPGPGWVIIFVGLGIWATEFTWAKTLLSTAQRAVGMGTAWIIVRQPRWLMVLAGVLVLIAVTAVAAGAWLVAR